MQRARDDDGATGHIRNLASRVEAVAASASHSVNARADAVAWRWSSFEQLPVAHLYAAISLRESIFVVEQNVPYLDADGRDPHCRHLTGFVDGRLVAYARVLPKDLFEPGFFSFGRVVVHPEHRHAGIGRELVTLALAHLDEVRGNTPVKISSQFYLREFYQSFGFAPQGEPYIEDRILHIGMVRGHSSPGGRP